MSQSTYPIAPPGREQRPAIVVEMSMKPLPPRMRMGGLRSSLRIGAPGGGVMRRLLMAPVAMVMRVLSR